MNKPPEKSRIIVCGTARNIEMKVDAVISNITRSFSSFQELQIVFCESFSTDQTIKKLNEIKNNLSNFSFIHDEAIEKDEIRRTVRIASARNELQSVIRRSYSNFDYVAMLDLDGVNRDLTQKAVDSIWNHTNWDGAFANQPLRYYDIWALRARNWNEQDCWEMFETLSMSMPIKVAKQVAVTSKMRSISEKSAPIKVDSAFGGLGIYKMAAFLDGQYLGQDRAGKEICEHVWFHKTLTTKGYLLYLMPSLVNLNRRSQCLNIVKERLLKISRR